MTTTSTVEPRALASPKKLPWYRKLGMQVLVSLILGILVGFAFPKFASQLKLLGDMFLSLIKAGVAPLVFLTISPRYSGFPTHRWCSWSARSIRPRTSRRWSTSAAPTRTSCSSAMRGSHERITHRA